MSERPRLIEVAFPLKQASLDSLHEKSVRHGHLSTLHLWPARRPLAASRAALIATLLPDPGTPEERRELLLRMGGKVVSEVVKKKVAGKTVEVVKSRTEGGILHWGNENSPDLEWFRQEIKKAYGGRPPRVLDPFAGGGAIPLEAMRLGCEATAIDINPVAWLVLKCTLDYPKRLAGQTRPLPRFASDSPEFMAEFLKGSGKLSKKKIEKELQQLKLGIVSAPEADLAWHVRAWGRWVFLRAKAELESFYPTIDGKPPVAYLWARTVKCKNCRASIPLLKTRWLCKKDQKRVLLKMEPNADRSGVVFDVEANIPVVGGNAAQRKAHDKHIGAGTMTRSGVTCPCCGVPSMTMDDLRTEGKAKRFGHTMTAVVVSGAKGREYRLPTPDERKAAEHAASVIDQHFADIPFGLPTEQTPGPAGSRLNSSSLRFYGFFTWIDLFTPRQLLTLASFIRHTRAMRAACASEGYPLEFAEAIFSYLSLAIDRLADYSSALCSWHNSGEKLRNTFGRFAFPIVWDYTEVAPFSETSGGYRGALDWIAWFIERTSRSLASGPSPHVVNGSVISSIESTFDVIVTDPPYYDAIAYSDLMDFFYVWLRRTTLGLDEQTDRAFSEPLGPKWHHEKNDGELIDNPTLFDRDLARSKANYEDGMFRAFRAGHDHLTPDGRFVVVFAHKHPDAWESLASAIIRAGFVVDASWPIQTEMSNRARALASSALSSSVWLVCKKRPETARPGWDNRVMDEMRENIHKRLRDFWDVGIRGPDFVWAATGPALEAYSRHPVVKKANEPGKVMEVSEFLGAVRRLVVDFVVGRVLTHNGGSSTVSGLDDLTTYYILHRHDFGLTDAPIGPCILYAVSCNLSDNDLANRHELLLKTGGLSASEDDDEEEEDEDAEDGGDLDHEEGTGSTVKLRPWHQRKRKTLGYDTDGRAAPLIDQVHRLMHLWKGGDVSKVNEYLDARGLKRNVLFHQLLQALIELAGKDNQRDERTLLESLSNHIAAQGVAKLQSPELGFQDVEAEAG